MKLLVLYYMISRNRRIFYYTKLPQSHVGVRRSFTARSPSPPTNLADHCSGTSVIKEVRANTLAIKEKQQLYRVFSWKTPLQIRRRPGPLSIQSRLLKVAKNEMNTLRPFLIITLPSFRIPYTFIQLLLFGIVLFNLLKQSIKLIELTERYETEFDNLHGMLDWNQSSSNRTIAFDWFVDWICTPGSKVLSLFSQDLLMSLLLLLEFDTFPWYSISLTIIDSTFSCVCSVIVRQDHRWRQNVIKNKEVAHECRQFSPLLLLFFLIVLVYSFSEKLFNAFTCTKQNSHENILQNCLSWHTIATSGLKVACSLGILKFNCKDVLIFFRLPLAWSKIISQKFSKPRTPFCTCKMKKDKFSLTSSM